MNKNRAKTYLQNAILTIDNEDIGTAPSMIAAQVYALLAYNEGDFCDLIDQIDAEYKRRKAEAKAVK